MREIREIVEVELVDQEDQKWSWRAGNGLPHHGRGTLLGDELEVGDRLVVEVAISGGTYRLVRVVRTLSRGISARVPPVHTPPRPPRAYPVTRSAGSGDVVLRRLRFSGHGDGRNSKLRPCVVVEVGGPYLRVLPIFGTNSAVRREGLGRRLRDWRAAGLNKPSVVASTEVWVSVAGAPPIGTLSDFDRQRVLGR
jgi:hypothetical protein